MSKVKPTAARPVDRAQLRRSEHGPAAGGRAAGPLRVALIYPNSYHVGMSSLGMQLARQSFESGPGVACERFFLDTAAGGSIETGSPLGDFEILAFSAAYEMDIPNFLEILEIGGLEIEARRRDPSRGTPLVVVGGVLVSVNRLPLYPFIDVFAHGEAEALLPPFLEALMSIRERTHDRAELLYAISGLAGWEVTAGAWAAAGAESPRSISPFADFLDAEPQFESAPWLRPAPPEPAVLQSLAGTPCATDVLTPNTEFADMALIDLARGCPHHCTFCWIGHEAPAYRTRPVDQILNTIEHLSRWTDRFGLVASAVGAHPGIDEICEWILARGLRVSYSSLRVEEVSEPMLRALMAGGQKTVTIAPEAGAWRVRRLLGKIITDDQILDVTERIMAMGAENLKMYFMIGIPSETDDEALEIAAFTEKIRAVTSRHGRARGRLGSIGINLGVFVPKPGLPLNHIEPVPINVVRARLRRVVQRLDRIPNVQVNASGVELARAQGVLAMGGVEASRLALLVREHGGDWRAALRAWDRRPEAAWPGAGQKTRITKDKLQRTEK